MPFFHEKIGLNFWITVIFVTVPILIAIAALITFKIQQPVATWLKKKLKHDTLLYLLH